jgi:hypothetical protein
MGCPITVVRAYNSSGMLSSESVEVSRRVGVPFSVRGDFTGDFGADVDCFVRRPARGHVSGLSGHVGGSGDTPVIGD